MPLPAWKDDAFCRGCFGGVVAGIIKNLCDYGLLILKVKTAVFWKIAGVIAFSKPPVGIVENTVSLFLELVFCAFIGIIYIVIHSRFKTKCNLVMGMLYGALVWFFIKASFLLFHLTELKKDLLIVANPISHLVLSILFGLILAALDTKWSKEA